MRKFLTSTALLIAIITTAQTYQPNWQSLDTRPTPTWFRDAKFGIFIHWGVYAVPGWSTKGNYAEWYQQGLQTTDTARMKFHKAKFGDRTYYDLAKDFKAELYKPDEWARLFEKSGAKYIVLTSKHHDGFTLWPNKESSKTWGFPWNAMEAGPKRDLLGDLFTAVRKTSVRAGMYYSLYEWFNPLWLSDKPAYVKNHVWPQMKELITNYQPDVFWTDGDWDAPAETWKSPEFLTWLFNESPVKDKVIVNDRWGSGIRFKHGGIFTPEYQPDLDFENHDWEESRGMGYSYGYNREEDAWDYNSTQSLVIALIDKVSRGGNFLLDIGPDEHGKIPPIMQERLLEIGEWLRINGEAIYETTRWKTPSQWSAGKRGYKFKNEHAADDWKTGGDIMLKLTVDPEPGYAVKELFYTYNEKTNSLFGIFPKYPDNKKLVLQNIILPAGTAVSFLSGKQNLSWKQEGNNVVVELPEYNPNKIKAPYAYAIKIAGYGKFTAKPEIKLSKNKASVLLKNVSMQAADAATIRYTIDGSEPAESSPVYNGEFTPGKTTIIKAKAFQQGLLPSEVATQEVEVLQWKAFPKQKLRAVPGLQYAAYELNPVSVLDLQKVSPVKKGTAAVIDLSVITRKENIGLRFQGFIKIEKDDVYTFYLSSDDGTYLSIDGNKLIDNDGLHGSEEKQGSMALRKGYHIIDLMFIQATGGIDLKLQYSTDEMPKRLIPASVLFNTESNSNKK